MRGTKIGKVLVAPKNAGQFAAYALKLAKNLSKVTLDYSVGSLRHIDDILEGYYQEHLTVDDVWLSLFCLGCYVGEVIVRNNRGARWISLPEDRYESELDTGMVVRLATGTIVNPIGKAEKHMLNGDIDSVEYLYKAFVEDDPGKPTKR